MSGADAVEAANRVLLGPVVTEKSTTLSEGIDDVGVSYVFNVARDATKPQIKRAVERVFEVSVTGVRVHNVKGKKRNLRHRGGGVRKGRKAGIRRAFVRLADGDNIDFWDFNEKVKGAS